MALCSKWVEIHRRIDQRIARSKEKGEGESGRQPDRKREGERGERERGRERGRGREVEEEKGRER